MTGEWGGRLAGVPVPAVNTASGEDPPPESAMPLTADSRSALWGQTSNILPEQPQAVAMGRGAWKVGRGWGRQARPGGTLVPSASGRPPYGYTFLVGRLIKTLFCLPAVLETRPCFVF